MRSSRSRFVGLAVCFGLWLGAGGCNLVLGVSSETAPCDDASFAAAAGTRITRAEAFSVSWDQDQVLYSADGITYDRPLPSGDPIAVDAVLYVAMALALSPEGDAMFVTAEIEPPVLQAAIRSSATHWTTDAIVPRGTLAGAPSAAEFGARRVLVRLRVDQPAVQEYEAAGDHWQPIGDVHPIGGPAVPNLTPNGLDMVYEDADASGPAVFVAHRRSIDTWFGDPVAILPGEHRFPQLLGRCRTLYALDTRAGDPTSDLYVRRYDR